MTNQQDQPDNKSPSVTIDQHVGRRLQMVRRKHGLSTTTLGRALGVPMDTVARWELGSLRIPARHLLELSQLLSCPLTVFFDDFPLGANCQGEIERTENRVNAMFDERSDAKH